MLLAFEDGWPAARGEGDRAAGLLASVGGEFSGTFLVDHAMWLCKRSGS